MNFASKSVIHENPLGSFTRRKAGTWDILFYFPSEGRHTGDFPDARKIQRLRPGLNPPVASMLTTRPPKPSIDDIINIFVVAFETILICHNTKGWSSLKSLLLLQDSFPLTKFQVLGQRLYAVKVITFTILAPRVWYLNFAPVTFNCDTKIFVLSHFTVFVG